MAGQEKCRRVTCRTATPGPLLIIDPSKGPKGRAVCILPENSALHAPNSTLERARRQWAAHRGG